MASNRSSKKPRRPQRRVVVRGVQRPEPDARKLSRAVLALLLAQAENDAQAEDEKRRSGKSA